MIGEDKYATRHAMPNKVVNKTSAQLKAFHELVAMKYQIYNGLFLTLPFEDLESTGAQLPFFFNRAKSGLESGKSPKQIVQEFLNELGLTGNNKQIKTLFKLIQFVERQVVLFDALEDAAFDQTHNMIGPGTLLNLFNSVKDAAKEELLESQIENYKVRIVLTAHPTQFYTNSVLGIISDLCVAIQNNQLTEIRNLLLQMGKTPFMNRRKPSPLDEAKSLVWYLENIFYETFPFIYSSLQTQVEELTGKPFVGDAIELGFWPGGDRDGNPFVTAEITEDVAKLLKSSLVNLYINDIKQLKRRLTFEGVYEKLEIIQAKLEGSSLKEICNLDAASGVLYKAADELKTELLEIKDVLIEKHQSLFIESLNSLIAKVQLFGFHFASLDLRQDSRIHAQVLDELMNWTKSTILGIESDHELKQVLKVGILTAENASSGSSEIEFDESKLSEIAKETLASFRAARTIQLSNGQKGLHRYVISNTKSSDDVLKVIAMARLAGWPIQELELDIIPLFESIEDLEQAESIMRELYTHPVYGAHLKKRQNLQTIMLGFSDGTKDGGYLTANWSIFKAKQKLTQISREHGVKVVFFDGRGGPPARGGGNTHKFYRSLGKDIEHDQIQLTIQGQTISSNFGTKEAAKYNFEQLFTAGLEQKLFPEHSFQVAGPDYELMQKLSQSSYKAYLQLRNHELFVPYLEEVTPLRYYDQLNIASRPQKRNAGSKLKFEDLRAIPFVGAWTQMKQNIAGFYGLGSALKEQVENGELESLEKLYETSLFFRTLLENAMQSLCKSYFPLTQYLSDDPKFGQFWQMVLNEAILTEKLLKQISGQPQLMSDSELSRESINLREKIVLPLLTIQHYALEMVHELKQKGDASSREEIEVLEKIIIKSLAANVNASRNSV